MVAISILCLSLAFHGGDTPKPPKVMYDAKRDVTTYSTGDVRTAGYSGYGAKFEFPGKTFSEPALVVMGFGALRLTHGAGSEHDQEALHWNGVDSISIVFGVQSLRFPATHEFKVSTDKRVTALLGRALEESLSTSVTPDELKEMASEVSIEVLLGKDKQVIKGKSLEPLKRLAATLPEIKPDTWFRLHPADRG